MRVSIDPEDPGYSPHLMNSRVKIRVWLEGVERGHILTADEEKRFAVLHHLDSEGKLSLDKDGNVRTEKFYGHVRIEIEPADIPRTIDTPAWRDGVR